MSTNSHSEEKLRFIINDLRDSALKAFCPESLRHYQPVRDAYQRWAASAYHEIKLLEERCPL